MIKVVLLISIFVSFSFSHKLSVFTEFENDILFVSAYFANGNACQNCKLEIKKENTLLLTSTTNEKGEFESSLNEKVVSLSVDAGAGHVVTKTIKQEKIEKVNLVNKQLQKLQEENKKLKQEVSVLKQKLEHMDIFKTIFALLVIIGIFAFLKRVKN